MLFERGTQSRRGFLARSVGAMTAAGLPGWYAQQVLAADPAPARRPMANGKVNVGWIGIGSPASRAFGIYGTTRGFKELAHVGVCDVDARHLTVARERLAKDGHEAKGVEDFRALNDRKDIDAVVVATPDHWHTLIAIDALRKGKDIYCEKPLTLTIEESLALQKVAKETGRVVQTGSQQRTEMKQFRLAADLVRSGRLGKIKTIECRIGGVEPSGPIAEAPVPDGLNWDLWLGPTPKVPYRYEERVEKDKDGKVKRKRVVTNCHYEFRWFYDYSGGKMTDWGAHHLDIAQWMLGTDGSGPTGVEVVDAKVSHKGNDGYNCHETFRVRYTYPGGTEVFAMDGRGREVAGLVRADGKAAIRGGKGGTGAEKEISKLSGGENGVLVIGENGTLFVSRGTILASDPKILSEPLKEDPKLYPSRPTNHFGNFLDCLKSREKPICDETVGGGSVIVCHLGVIALQMGVGTKLTWDPKSHRFTGSNAEAANAKLGREMRAPWKLDV
jgi:predicted dehydrogenase